MERFVSHYFWVKRVGDAGLRLLLDTEYPTVERYARGVLNGSVWFYGIDNHQTRMIAGDLQACEFYQLCCVESRACGNIPRFEVGSLDLHAAKTNLLRRFPVVGTVGRLLEYQAMMYLVFGFSAFTLAKYVCRVLLACCSLSYPLCLRRR